MRTTPGWRLALTIAFILLVLATVGLVGASRQLDEEHAAIDQIAADQTAFTTELGRRQTDLAAARQQLGDTIVRLQTASDALAVTTGQRDEVAQQADKTRKEMQALHVALNNNLASIFVQAQHLGQLGTCLRSADQALNAMSTNNRELAKVILDGAEATCSEVRSYLQSKGLVS